MLLTPAPPPRAARVQAARRDPSQLVTCVCTSGPAGTARPRAHRSSWMSTGDLSGQTGFITGDSPSEMKQLGKEQESSSQGIVLLVHSVCSPWVSLCVTGCSACCRKPSVRGDPSVKQPVLGRRKASRGFTECMQLSSFCKWEAGDKCAGHSD